MQLSYSFTNFRVVLHVYILMVGRVGYFFLALQLTTMSFDYVCCAIYMNDCCVDNRSAILALLMSMVSEKQPIALRFAALYCFQVCTRIIFNYSKVVGGKNVFYNFSVFH